MPAPPIGPDQIHFLSKNLEMVVDALSLGKIGIWELNLITNEVYWSEHLYRIHELPFGQPATLEEGINFYREDFRQIVKDAVDRGIKEGKPWDLECVLISTSGKEVWVKGSGKAIYENGKAIKIRGFFQEINEKKQRELELREKNTLLRGLFDRSSIFTGLTHPDGSIIELNQKILDFWGLAPEQIFGKKIYDAPRWAKNQEVRKQLIKGVRDSAKGKTSRFEVRLDSPESVTDLDLLITPLIGQDKKIQYLLLEGLDITEQVQLRSYLRDRLYLFKTFLDEAPLPVAMFDKEMRYLAASRRWYMDYKLKEEDIIGKSHYEIFPEILKMPHWLKIHQRVLNGEVFKTQEDRFERSDGSVQYLRYTLIPWKDDKGMNAGMFMYTEDITSQVEYQHALANLNQKLEEEVNARTAQLLKLNKEMEQFVYVASHDLQEPLRTISNYTQALQEDGISSSKADFLLSRLSLATGRMQNLVHDLLDYSKIGREQDLAAIDPEKVVKEIIQDFDFLVKKKGANIEVGKMPQLYATRSDIRQLFQNLISNGLKYQAPENRPLIRITAEKVDGQYRFSVSDNGIGMKEKYLGKIFQIFQRLHNREEFSGTGIGLAMCKKIVDTYEGAIWVESEPEMGSTFYFTIPKALLRDS